MANAIRMFYLLAAVKAIGLGLMIRFPRPHAALFITWFAIGIVLSLVAAAALHARASWSRPFAIIYAGAHAAGILASPLLGVGVLVSGVIGIAALSFLIRDETV